MLDGGAGNAIPNGGDRADVITSGWGADVVILTLCGGRDMVTDFNITLADGLTTDQLDVSELKDAQGGKLRWAHIAVNDGGFGNAS